jgi:hypothetical protein
MARTVKTLLRVRPLKVKFSGLGSLNLFSGRFEIQPYALSPKPRRERGTVPPGLD